MCKRLPRPAYWLVMGICSLLCGLMIVGCGGDPPPPAEPAVPEQTDAASTAAPVESTAVETSSPPQAAGTARMDGEGRKWIGDIPYDVWFDNPLAVAANTEQVAAVGGAATAPPVAESDVADMPMPEPEAAGTESSADWKSLIPARVVAEEATKLRNRLAENLRSVGSFNRAVKDVQWDGATLAGIAAIAIEHPDSISWKDKAKFIRELGVQIELAADKPGKPALDAAQLPYERFVALLDGNTPAELPEAADRVPFADSVSRSGVMHRMERAFEYLRKNIVTEERFNTEADAVAHETAILAAFVKLSASEGYAFTDEAEFQKHAAESLEALGKMQQAIQAKSYAPFAEGLSAVQRKCDECHNAGYRF